MAFTQSNYIRYISHFIELIYVSFINLIVRNTQKKGKYESRKI
ncbi:hypothetical protein HMPREF9099_01932 [Lachnospiraceae bacterium oral taxon 082 str. F0431]|nr:hypothetical protein HMPREF9099_01932 [Lachnospiraceae bacterium oral taxon 082 str. F0431]